MSTLQHLLLFPIVLVVCPGDAHAGDTIVLPPGRFQVDHELQLIVSDLSTDLVNAQWPGPKTMILADSWYELAPAMAEIPLGTEIIVEDTNGVPYHVYFTELPLISITTAEAIVDEPRVHGNFTLSDGTGQVTIADLGIEYRGGVSQLWPKKSYRIEFWTDSTGSEHVDLSLLGMRSDDDWNLQAMYNEPLRMRNVVCNELWRMIHAPYYLAAEPDAVTGVAMEHVELFVNGAYKGLYAASERIDRKQLKLKAYNGSIRGQLYKGVSWGASTFSSAPPYNNSLRIWSGFEYEYPTEVTEWSFLHDFVDFVVHAPEAEFLAEYPSRFELDNAVDYLIFLNLLRATDNAGKNIYVALYDTETPYFYVPYDLDGTFGVIWDGSQENITDDLLLNGFYVRLMHDCGSNGFMDRLRQRWNELRTDIITQGNITGLFAQEFAHLAANGVYQRELMAWPDYVYEPAQLDYLSNWLAARLSFLDDRFNAPCEPSGIIEEPWASFSMYPNPATDRLFMTVDGAGTTVELSLTDALGRIVLVRELTGERNVIDLSGFGKGLYLVHVRRNGRTSTDRLVIN